MTGLNERQGEALAELVNFAFSLTAAKLSEISGHRVVVAPPTVGSHTSSGLAKPLNVFASGEVVSIHQAFSGPFSGSAILCLNSAGASNVSNLLIEENLQLLSLDSSAGEILTEIGNMLLSACLGVFGNLLQAHISFSVPELHQDSLSQLLASLASEAKRLEYAVVINTTFNLRENGVNHPLAIVLGVSSLEQLAEAVDEWDGSQVALK